MAKSFVTVLILLCAGVVTGAQQPAVPKPGAEQKALAKFVGTWKMDGMMETSPMGPGGKITGTETCRMFEGGWHLTCESRSSGAMGPMEGQAIMTYDRAAKTYRYFAINNMADADMATGTFDGKVWTWTSSAEMDGKKIHSRFVITLTSDTAHTFKWEMSMDGKTWNTMMHGTSTKTSS